MEGVAAGMYFWLCICLVYVSLIFVLFCIRGLLGGHVAADVLKNDGVAVEWYNDELLDMAKDIGERLMPAFNTTTGIPYPKVLKFLQ